MAYSPNSIETISPALQPVVAHNLKPILVADDDEDDVVILLKSFQRVGIQNPSCVVPNGAEAIDYLAGIGTYRDRDKYPFPGLMLLDLKMPKRDGLEVLSWWKQQPQSSKLCIIMLSGSVLPEDIEKAKSAGASAYRAKPIDFPKYVDLAKEVRDYWLGLSEEELNSPAIRQNFYPAP